MITAIHHPPQTIAVGTIGSSDGWMQLECPTHWDAAVVDTISVLEEPPTNTVVVVVEMLVEDEQNHNDHDHEPTITSTTCTSTTKLPTTVCPPVESLSKHRSRKYNSVTKRTVSSLRLGYYSVFNWIVVLLLLYTSPSLFYIPTTHHHQLHGTTPYFFGHALSSSSSSSSKPPPNILPWQDRTLKVAFVTGNAMKAREVENIVEEHCYNRNYNMYNDDFKDGSDKNRRTMDIDDIRSDDDYDDYDNGYDDDDDTCALLQLDLTVTSINLPEIQEVDTIAIAKQKAILAAQLVNGPCVVEDTSLEFHALGGMPGPYIKWFQETLKSQGLYNILAAYENKNATAKCTLAYIPAPHADPILFTGVCHGHIVAPQPKMYGFGWDTIFVPNEHTIPFSQMNMETKNLVSHRGHAVRQWADWLGQNQNALLERQHSAGTTTFLGHQGLTFKIRPNNNLPDVRK